MGADVNAPLHLANEYPKIRVAEVLIANGANVNPLNKEGETPLDIRIEHPDMSDFMPSGYNTTDTPEETEEDPLVTLLRNTAPRPVLIEEKKPEKKNSKP